MLFLGSKLGLSTKLCWKVVLFDSKHNIWLRSISYTNMTKKSDYVFFFFLELRNKIMFNKIFMHYTNGLLCFKIYICCDHQHKRKYMFSREIFIIFKFILLHDDDCWWILDVSLEFYQVTKETEVVFTKKIPGKVWCVVL